MAVRNKHLELPDDFSADYVGFAEVLNDRFRRIAGGTIVEESTVVLQGGGGGGGTDFDYCVFGVGIGHDLFQQVDASFHYMAPFAGTWVEIGVDAKYPCEGRPIILDIHQLGGDSILDGNKITIEPGAASPVAYPITTFALPAVAKWQKFRIDVDQAGLGVPGSGVVVKAVYRKS